MLTKRQEEILKLIVMEYIKLAKPVGSKLICDRLNCSSATVRNEMVELEELGLLEKTHTSSGRVPSEKGYRYYVDNLMELKELNGEDVFKLQYRLTYIPTTSARVVQSKAYKEDIKKSISIAYNQSASKLSSRAYGENLKGAIAKMGNVEKLKMYIFPTVDLVPKCGQLFDEDYYISTVRTEYYPNFIKCE